jgi:peptide subunit release factor RF-3
MKRTAAFAALVGLSVAWPIGVKAQSSGLADYERQSRVTYKKQQKEANREAKRQVKRIRNAEKKQRKAMKRYAKEQRQKAKR